LQDKTNHDQYHGEKSAAELSVFLSWILLKVNHGQRNVNVRIVSLFMMLLHIWQQNYQILDLNAIISQALEGVLVEPLAGKLLK
jgi:hypothetical protein